jgi:hypothetical protein
MSQSRLAAGQHHQRAMIAWNREIELPLPGRPIVLGIVSSGWRTLRLYGRAAAIAAKRTLMVGR